MSFTMNGIPNYPANEMSPWESRLYMAVAALIVGTGIGVIGLHFWNRLPAYCAMAASDDKFCEVVCDLHGRSK
ncbi:MAG: hypothetical protein LBG89_01960 [Rickettsiales bacterium]|jgi:hypothetical protein|nr:hypothetical protein [Rickettsiales bacterium]